MKNYTYGWLLEEKGYTEVPKTEYTDANIDMEKFINSMSDVIASAKCGWNKIEYKVMVNKFNDNNEYMVLSVDGGGSRWIPINGNSKGCNFTVLGENLW